MFLMILLCAFEIKRKRKININSSKGNQREKKKGEIFMRQRVKADEIDYNTLKIKHFKCLARRGILHDIYYIRGKIGNNYLDLPLIKQRSRLRIVKRNKKEKKKVNNKHQARHHNDYNIYSGCFIMVHHIIYACVNYWFVVLANNNNNNNISIPCKCICYKNYRIVPTFYNTVERSCNILYKVHK